jgi:hypothetical protein
MIIRTSAARPCRSSGCDPPPSCVASSLAPGGNLELAGLAIACERRALALLPCCPPQLQHPRPTVDPSVPFLTKKDFANAAPTPSSEEYLRVFRRGKDISDMPSGRFLCRCTDIMLFLNPPYMAPRRLLIPRIAAAGTSFRPLPCQAWHGYKVTNARRVEVEVGIDGPASAPLSGVAAAAPPAGALEHGYPNRMHDRTEVEGVWCGCG